MSWGSSFIRITRYPYEEPYYVNLVVVASTPTWEEGSERSENLFAFFFRLRVIEVAAGGHCAIEVRFNNNEEPPARELVEFSIPAAPADFDRLADLLERFAELKHEVLEWTVTDGELR